MWVSVSKRLYPSMNKCSVIWIKEFAAVGKKWTRSELASCQSKITQIRLDACDIRSYPFPPLAPLLYHRWKSYAICACSSSDTYIPSSKSPKKELSYYIQLHGLSPQDPTTGGSQCHSPCLTSQRTTLIYTSIFCTYLELVLQIANLDVVLCTI